MTNVDGTRWRDPLGGLVTVMWHYVRTDAERPRVGAGWIEPAAFDQQLDRIARHHTVVGWPAVAGALDGGPPLPRDAVLLTFDDGLADHHRTVGPRLAARGWPGLFFVLARRAGDPLPVGHKLHLLLADRSASELGAALEKRLPKTDRHAFGAARERESAAGAGPLDALKRVLQRDLAGAVEPLLSALIDRHVGREADLADALLLSDGQIAGLRQSAMAIGGHGRRHLWFDWESDDAVHLEISDSARWLLAEPPPWAFAYPYGVPGPVGPSELARAGFAAGFSTGPGSPGMPYDIGRIDAEDEAAFSAVFGPRGGR